MRNSYLLLLGILLASLFLSGCAGGKGGSQYDIPLDSDYRKGYQGLSLEFVKGAPPLTILEDSIFSIGVIAKNQGASDIEGGVLALSYDEDYIDLTTTNSKLFKLEGKKATMPEGQNGQFFFDAHAKFLDIESLKRDIPISATACYLYAVQLDDTICVDLPYETSQEKGKKTCTVRDKSYGGQGGPVGISAVDITTFASESTQMAKVVFDVTITHSGRGIVVEPDQYRSICTAARSGTDALNYVRIVNAFMSDKPLLCNKQSVQLRENMAKIRCEGPDVDFFMLPFDAPIHFELEYGYVTTESTKMTITAQ